MRVEHQVAIIYLGTKGLLKDIPVKRVKEFEAEYLNLLEVQQKAALDTLKKGQIDDNVTSVLEKTAKELISKYKV
jgi:F-type H+-transporting ATPase subunit alpha